MQKLKPREKTTSFTINNIRQKHLKEDYSPLQCRSKTNFSYLLLPENISDLSAGFFQNFTFKSFAEYDHEPNENVHIWKKMFVPIFSFQLVK